MKKEHEYPKALHEAVKRADLKEIRELLAAGVSPNGRDPKGLPPIAYVLYHYDAYGFSLTYEIREMIRLLRDAGADPAVGGAREHVMADAVGNSFSSGEATDCSRQRELLK
jgi:hypothetical protein